jgi:hypothetical protein
LRPLSSGTDREAATIYEIFHDILGPAVLEWQERYRRRRRRRRAIGIGIAVLLFLGATMWFASIVKTEEQTFIQSWGASVGICAYVWVPLLIGIAVGRLWRRQI